MIDLFLFRNALRDLMRPKKLTVGIVLILLPSLLALVLRLNAGENYRAETIYNVISAGLIFGIILVLLSVVFSTGVIAQEIEQKTIVYLLTRPVPRWRIALVKFAAATLYTTVTVWLACGLLALTTFGVGGLRPTALLRPSQVKDAKALLTRLKDTPDTLSLNLYTGFGKRTQDRLTQYDTEKEPEDDLVRRVVGELNRAIQKQDLYSQEAFKDIALPEETKALLDKKMTGQERERLNRALLEAAYPEAISQASGPAKTLLRDFAVLPMGVLAYSAVFLLLATLINRPLIVGLIFAFGWETWAPNLPGNFGKFSLMSYVRTLSKHEQPDNGLGGAGNLLQAFNPATISSRMAWLVLAGVFVFSLLTALLVFSNREYTPREDE